MSDVYIGLGSNLGDRAEHLRYAVRGLSNAPGLRLRAVSSFRLTAPAGGPPQPDYVNAVARLEAALAPRSLLCLLLELERRRGRRRGLPNGPRTLDLDLLWYGAWVCRDAELTLPHPRLTRRKFVLEPLAELAPLLPLDAGRSAEQCLLAVDPHAAS